LQPGGEVLRNQVVAVFIDDRERRRARWLRLEEDAKKRREDQRADEDPEHRLAAEQRQPEPVQADEQDIHARRSARRIMTIAAAMKPSAHAHVKNACPAAAANGRPCARMSTRPCCAAPLGVRRGTRRRNGGYVSLGRKVPPTSESSVTMAVPMDDALRSSFAIPMIVRCNPEAKTAKPIANTASAS